MSHNHFTISRKSKNRLLQVPNANHRITNNPLFNSMLRYGATENEATSHKIKLTAILMVAFHFPANFFQAGFIKLITEAIIVDSTMK